MITLTNEQFEDLKSVLKLAVACREQMDDIHLRLNVIETSIRRQQQNKRDKRYEQTQSKKSVRNCAP